MISNKELKGDWGQLKEKIREKWGQVTENQLMQADGNVEKLVGMIQQKTGVARREIEEFLEQATASASNLASPIAAAAQNYAQQASEAVSHGYEQVADRVQKGLHETTLKSLADSRTVQDLLGAARGYARANPEAAAFWCLGIGFVLGWKMKP